MIKCVAWDLDDTLWPGVALESDALPAPRPRALRLLAELERRGIVSSIASRGDPSVLERLRAIPELAGRFVAPQAGWDPKSAALARIARELGIGLDAVALLDEDPFERAQVEHLAPEATTLTLDSLERLLAATPAAATEEGARRTRLYLDQERRQRASAEWTGSQLDFLRWCRMELDVAEAVEADKPRLAELAERTNQLNSTGRRYDAAAVARWANEPGWLLARARLTDRFGDYGTIGLAAVNREPWLVELLAVSCRVEGRGVPAALLRWVMERARAAGAEELAVRYAGNGRNVRLGLLFRQLGFRGGGGLLRRPLAGGLPPYPEWLTTVRP